MLFVFLLHLWKDRDVVNVHKEEIIQHWSRPKTGPAAQECFCFICVLPCFYIFCLFPVFYLAFSTPDSEDELRFTHLKCHPNSYGLQWFDRCIQIVIHTLKMIFIGEKGHLSLTVQHYNNQQVVVGNILHFLSIKDFLHCTLPNAPQSYPTSSFHFPPPTLLFPSTRVDITIEACTGLLICSQLQPLCSSIEETSNCC